MNADGPDSRPASEPAAGLRAKSAAWTSAERRARERRERIADMARGPRVLEVGYGSGALALVLARKGFTVVGVNGDAEQLALARSSLAGRAPDVRNRVTLQQAVPDGERFDTGIVGDALYRTADPAALLQSVLSCLVPDGLLIVTVSVGQPEDDAQENPVRLTSFVDTVRGLCRPESLELRGATIFFVGRNAPPRPGDWDRYDPGMLLGLLEDAIVYEQRRYLDALRKIANEIEELRSSLSFQLGFLFVNAAKRPWQAWRLPGQLLRASWNRYRAAKAAGPGEPVRRVDFPVFPAPVARPRSGLVIAAIVDAFTESCLRYEGDLVLPTQRGWRAELAERRPALLFVESAWQGNNGEWRFLLSQYARRNPNPLKELLAWCRTAGIPTVFWNKDDPPHFETFLDAAVDFDVIFTSDADCIPRYREACGHDRVYALPFAAQPRVHNPMRNPDWPRYPVVFAGSWYADRYPDRRERLSSLLDPAMEHGLHIFDRHQSIDEGAYRFPERYQAAIQGTLPYDRMLTAYRCYRVMLNANSVSDSPTMFSRRVFESLACGTPVVSTASTAMERMLGGHVRIARTSDEAHGHLRELLENEDLRLREGHRAYRFVHRHHTWRRRLDEVLGRVGVPGATDAAPPPVTVIMATMRPANVERCLETFRRQTHPRKELILALNNGSFDVESIRAQARNIPDAHVLHVEGATTLGDCLNAAVGRASGAYVAKMDDDDHYGDDYLSDQLLAAEWSGADVVGKGTYFTFLEWQELLGLRSLCPEHGFTQIVSGATLVVTRDLLKDIRFRALPRGTDTAFLADVVDNGGRVYSSDRFNFVLVRKKDTGQHTWRIEADEFAKLCVDLRPGLDLSRVMI